LPVGNFTASHINAAGVFTYDSRYRERAEFTDYDSYGNVLEERYTDNKRQGYLWDYMGQHLIAKCVNAAQADMAATSFEADGKGNFLYAGLPVADADAPTGTNAYPLATGSIAKAVDAGKNYVVSFWAKGSVTVNSGTLYRTGSTLKGYTYYEYSIGNTANLTISGTGTVDELRLYPKAAQMVTYTYKPLVGITSESDINGNITYYQYDAFGRLQYIRDMNGKVLKVMEYGYRKGVTD
jgi:YD repeat-containing protein